MLMSMSMSNEIRAYWDEDAATYDSVPGHQPRSAAELAAWSAALAHLLPSSPCKVLDCGAGTGFLSLILARLGHKVTALDVSAGMLSVLRRRAGEEGLGVEVVEGSAEDPPAGPFDVVVERHLLWTLPDPVAALRTWREVVPSGQLILVESLWGSADPLEGLRRKGKALAARVRAARVRAARADWRADWQSCSGGHHAPYPPEIVKRLPFGGGPSPSALVSAVSEAGWPDPWIERLRDVEWAATLDLTAPERLLGVAPRFVVTAG